MISEKIILNCLLSFCILFVVLTTIYTCYPIIRKKKNWKDTIFFTGIVLFFSCFTSFVIYWVILAVIKVTSTDVKEIVYEDGKYQIIGRYYFNKSLLPKGVNSGTLKDKGDHYYNATDKEVVCFWQFYFSDSFIKMKENLEKNQHKEKSLDLIHMTDPDIECDTVYGDVLVPQSYYTTMSSISCAFEPSLATITVKRPKVILYDADAITIMDLKDSVFIHHGVIFMPSKK